MQRSATESNELPKLTQRAFVHVYRDPPYCQDLEGPARLVHSIGDTDPIGFEHWLVRFGNSPFTHRRWVHPWDLIFTTTEAATAEADQAALSAMTVRNARRLPTM